MRLEIITEAIDEAIRKRCFLPALALSLVVPDICAKYDYPNIYNRKEEYNGRKGQGAAYEKWYDKNIGNYDIEPDTKISLLNGRGCWKLRCAFLHEGSIDIDEVLTSNDRNIHFTIISSKYSDFDGTIGGVSSVSYSDDKKNQNIEFDVANLCGNILEVLKHSYLTDNKFINETNNIKLNYKELNF